MRIHIKDVCVDYPISISDGKSFRRAIFNAVGSRFGQDSHNRPILKALQDISFDIADSGRVGLIGGNGAGKSTLLRVLAGVYDPTKGTRIVEGRVAPLLTIGMGMRDDITGWENINLCGALMGIPQQEIKERSGEIAEFSELGDHLMLPVSSYSAGMRTRLAFSIATAFDPEILIVDEVFGAGDASFYDKAQKRMEYLMDTSRIVVFASHNNDLVRRFCTHGILLDKGAMKKYGPIEDVLEMYTHSR